MQNRILESPWDNGNRPVILIIEDSDEDFYTFVRSIKKVNFNERFTHNILRFENGDEALEYLLREGDYESLNVPYPDLILLDLNLPGTDGREIVQQVKQSPDLKSIPVVVLTTSRNAKDVNLCYFFGANSYFLKPMGVNAMAGTVEILLDYWLNFSILPNSVPQLS